jgi:hypothetical protein
MKAKWLVLVVHEDTETRETAVAFCDHLVERFWRQIDFEVSWWPFASLAETASTRESAEKAVAADLIVFATRPAGEMPFHVRSWVATWLERRREREGALVGLTHGEVAPRGEATEKSAYLRQLAHRAGMDYLTEVPPSLSASAADSADSYNERAQQVTSVLDEILHQDLLPSQLKS